MKKQTIRLINDHFQNYKVYGIPKAQLVIADIPYNLGANGEPTEVAWQETFEYCPKCGRKLR